MVLNKLNLLLCFLFSVKVTNPHFGKFGHWQKVQVQRAQLFVSLLPYVAVTNNLVPLVPDYLFFFKIYTLYSYMYSASFVVNPVLKAVTGVERQLSG